MGRGQRDSGPGRPSATIPCPSRLLHGFRLVHCHQVRLRQVRFPGVPVGPALRIWQLHSAGLLPHSTRAPTEGSPPPCCT